MRRLFLTAALGALLLAACSAPTPDPVTPAAPAPVSGDPPTATPIPHAEALRLALVGTPTEVNAWALFDEAGASYANYALRDGDYPRLARLSIPAREVEPYVAESIPPVIAEGNAMVATASLRPALLWSDGSPLTAHDIVFTVEIAQAFQLQLDWNAAYPPVLERVEAVDEQTVKFHFNGPVHVGNWQYGILQGPIVSRAYWSPKLAAALSQLPSAESSAALNELKARAAELQSYIDADNAQLQVAVPGSADAASLTARITRNQNDLNSVNAKLLKAQDGYAAALAIARAALFALDDEGEPTFGPFLRARRDGNTFTREANPNYPFEKPHYDRAVYTLYDGFAAANLALTQSGAEVLLAASGAGQEPNAPSHPTASARFLVFNPQSQTWSGRALRTALACLIDKQAMLSGQEWAYDGFLPPGPWQESEPRLPCAGQPRAERIREAARLLQEAGYTWAQTPTPDQAGAGLKLPDGSDFPPASLLTAAPEYDLWRANSAAYIEAQARHLGIPLVRQELDIAALRYAVYSSGEYDLAILGWQLSEYPGYLCDWFGPGARFRYVNERITSACMTLRASADLEAARGAARMLQTAVMGDLPFVPLYLRRGFDGQRQVTYPFGSVLNGLAGLYGAPSLAIPAP